MRIQTLYEFLVLTSKLNFTETAKSLFMSQSVLSDHISGLEKELGTRLFVRDRHSVRLTEAGRLFTDDAETIIADYEAALGRLAQYREGVSSVVRIGFLMGTYGAILPVVCERYRRHHPEVEFRFRALDLGEIQKALSRNEIDVGFTLFGEGFEGSQYAHQVLYEDCYKLAVPKRHRLAKRTSVRIADLVGENVVAAHFNRAKSVQAHMNIKLQNAGVKISIIDDVQDAGALMAMCVAQNVVSVALDHLSLFSRDNLVFLPIEDLDTVLFVGPMWKASRETAALQSFLDFFCAETDGFTKDDFLNPAPDLFAN